MEDKITTEVVFDPEHNTMVGTLHVAGLAVTVYQHVEGGQIVVDMDSTCLVEKYVTDEVTEVPKLLVYCNEARIMDNGISVPVEEQDV